MLNDNSQELLIGAHTSTAGGLVNALWEGACIGATTVQIFTSNQRRWQRKLLSPEMMADFKAVLQETGLRDIMSHASYLINMASPNEETTIKSRQAFYEEVIASRDLGLKYVNFHPGAALNDSREAGLKRIIQGILLTAPLLENADCYLLLETTAGQGSLLGKTFEELAVILEGTKNYLPMGVCIDTCHIFAAGYDIRTKEGWDQVLQDFDRIIGLKYLKAFHLNDSIYDIGSAKDRHAALGNGKIGWNCFRFLMTDPRTESIPKYLETPDGCPLWQKEIALLRGMHAKKKKLL
ncbi:deoxyribonuclease IV [Candidatus Clavichlamydia salmonicola]|uniref:deoxyribonuclease IV n=1 Tax=Candidatus Clavichlamydia salmonicola TaxID=469812 RepID=UPI001890F553|nr:deoxyribonuclease IV [Candidatus Clavichlamydia salmonicola]